MPLFRLILLILLVPGLLTPTVAQHKNNFTIAFGSCSRHTAPQTEQLWADVIQQNPDIWVWIGDNVYADTHNMDSLQADYAKQKSHPDYQRMIKSFPIIGTWDDHDYCVNDGGKYFSKKNESKEKLLEFLDVPAHADVRKHDGVYQSFTYGTGKQKIKILLLDTRYFRDTLMRSNEKGKRYDINPDGDVLGDSQWTWLEKELTNSDARLHLIASSIQFLANDHNFEKWGNFPKARQRMLDLLSKTKPANALFISGDRHIAEFSKLTLPGLTYPLYDFTSSGLTHTWSEPWKESNVLRVGELVMQKNFGLIKIEWKGKVPVVTLQVRGKNNAMFLEERIAFSGK
jgi:alkaline phosphatase D